MGAPKFNAKCNQPLPAEFLEALASEASHRAVAERFGMTHPAIRWRRKTMFPSRTWDAAGTQTAEGRHLSAVDGDCGADGLTSRQREVAAMIITPLLLANLAREKPRKACAVCWRDVPSVENFACFRFLPGTKTAWCQWLVVKAKKAIARAQEQAKASLPQLSAVPGATQGPRGAQEQVCTTQGCGARYFKGRGGVGELCMRCYVARRKGKVPGPRQRWRKAVVAEVSP